MKGRIAAAVITAALPLTAAAPAAAWPTQVPGGTCDTTTVRHERPAGFRTLVTVRKTTVCRSAAGYVTGVTVKVTRFSVPR